MDFDDFKTCSGIGKVVDPEEPWADPGDMEIKVTCSKRSN